MYPSITVLKKKIVIAQIHYQQARLLQKDKKKK